MTKRSLLVILALVLVAPAHVRSQQFSAETLDAVVKVRAQVPAGARTAASLGPLREGSGVVIDSNGLVLTIGYLILEASHVQITDSAGRTVPARILGYDHATGFGLLRARSAVGGARPLPLGLSEKLDRGAEVLIPELLGERAVGAGGLRGVAPGVRGLLGIPARPGDLHRAAPRLVRWGGVDRSGRQPAGYRLASGPGGDTRPTRAGATCSSPSTC